jgi:hypothetical protein
MILESDATEHQHVASSYRRSSLEKPPKCKLRDLASNLRKLNEDLDGAVHEELLLP